MTAKKEFLQESPEDEINLVAVTKEFWSHRKSVIKVVAFFIALGLVYALQSKNYFTASTTIVPVIEGQEVGGNLGSLASLAGINLGELGSSGGQISPGLYPQIINSIPYRLELLNTRLRVNDSDTLVSFAYYFQEIYTPSILSILGKYTVGLPRLLIKKLKGVDKKNEFNFNERLIRLTDDQFELIEELDSKISLDINDEEGFVSLSITMPEAESSAQMTLRARELLQQYAMRFKTQKSKEQLAYLEERFQEKEKDFEEKKLKLALFQDRNNNINSAVARTKLLQLQSEYDLAFTVYSELAKQLEAQRLQVKKDTPIFTILKPVTIPNEKAGPKRSLILIGFTFLGFIVSLGYIYIKSLLPDLKNEWEKA